MFTLVLPLTYKPTYKTSAKLINVHGKVHLSARLSLESTTKSHTTQKKCS